MAAMALLGWLFGGCAGYRLGNIGGEAVQGVRSIYVPMVKNESYAPDLQVVVTNAIQRRFDTDGTLRTTDSDHADAELEVVVRRIYREALRPEVLDPLATAQYRVHIEAQATLINRRLGRKTLDHVNVDGATTYFTQKDMVEAERQALPLAAEDLAKNLVSLVVEGW
ncbi:conserved hypothetical protein [Candidatus Methylacidithermus pantelleriae]|uniref:Lipopolysaccharide-assembly n=1 Tax=Candidatus Methylacidithermus pantelleriae TaxID=2744239 RepID=A0A8J2BUT1_9BACT|nr:conserved hypothetical protein [Candidatus Methylacidithermus pantelleriae]